MGVTGDGANELPLYPGAKPCIGCSFCCRSAPCIYGECEPGGDCKQLVWDGQRWRCQLVLMSGRYAVALYVGEGCCSALNTFRRENRVPTPDEVAEMRRRQR
jgi:hypothetical protein